MFRYAILLLSFVGVLGCSNGCSSEKPPVKITPETVCKLPEFVHTPCGLTGAQACELVRACRDKVQAECFIRADGTPEPSCPALAECDAKARKLCER